MVRIGMTCSFSCTKRKDGTESPRMGIDIRFCDLIRNAGAHPVVIPPTEDRLILLRELEELDGIILSGSNDIDPARYGVSLHPATDKLHPRRETSDFCVIEFADRRQLPILAVCGGMQELNVHRGGTLHQHLPDLDRSPATVHCDPDRKVFMNHPISLAEGSLVHRILGENRLDVNSWHHQGINKIGRDLIPTAWSEDRVVEALEDLSRPFCLAVQWHPEDMTTDPIQSRLIDSLVEEAERRQQS